MGSYHQKMAVQGVELAVHKWLLSEVAGRDVGLEAALKDFVEKGHAARVREGYNGPSFESVVGYCNTHCVGSDNCPGFLNCGISYDTLKQIFGY